MKSVKQLYNENRVYVWITIAVLSLIIVAMFGWPLYRVWQQGLEGKAALNRAEQERQILVMQAKAEKEAAKERADAIKIVGAAAQKYPEYRYQEFMGAMGEALIKGEFEKIVFIPTEANIPITEAGRTIHP